MSELPSVAGKDFIFADDALRRAAERRRPPRSGPTHHAVPGMPTGTFAVYWKSGVVTWSVCVASENRYTLDRFTTRRGAERYARLYGAALLDLERPLGVVA